MGHWSRNIAAGVLMMLHAGAQAATALGEINIEMSGNIVDFTCVAEGNDSDKVVTLGTWPTKQLRTTGSRTQPMPFTLKLTGCPPGAASITFSGKADGSDSGLLALNDGSTAGQVAVEIRDADKTRLDLQQASQPVTVTPSSTPLPDAQTLAVVLPVMTVKGGSGFQVALGTDAPRASGDYLYITPAGAPEQDYSGGFTAVLPDGPASMTAPSLPGAWELRYMQPRGDGQYRMIGRAALTVE